MKKTWKVVVGIALTTALLVGCSEEGDIKKVTLSKQEQQVFIEQFISKSEKSIEPSELVKELNDHIAGLDQKKASDSVDALLYSIYQYKNQMNDVIKGLQPTLKTYEEKGINFNKKADIEKIDDKILKAFLEEAKSRYLIIAKENDQYIVGADFDKVLSLYKPYMADDLKAMVQFSKEEFAVKYYDEKNQKMNFDVVADRILLMEGLAKKYPNSYYTPWFNQSKDFYYQLYFGMNGNSITKKDQTLLPDVEAHFKSMMEKHSGTDFSKNISLFFDEYKKNGNKLNDNVYVFLLDLTKKEHESLSQQATGKESETNQVKNAIKEAIENNKAGKSEDQK